MTGDNFLRELAFRLRKMPQNEINEIINFYREAIDDRMEDGMKEEEAVAAMGEIEEIIKNIESECSHCQNQKAYEKSWQNNEAHNNEEFCRNEEPCGNGESCRNNGCYGKNESCGNEDFRGNIKENLKNMIKNFVENVENVARSTFTAEYEHYSTEDELYYIEVNDRNTEVIVKESADNMIHLEYCVDEDFFYKIDDSVKGELKVSKISRTKWGDTGSDSLKIYMPQSFKGNININTTNDEINIERIHCEKLVCHTSNDEINLTNVIVRNDCELITKNDEINLKNVELGNYAALRTTNDDISLCEVTVCKALKCVTTNGDIEGSIYGRIEDFNVCSSTTNGENNLPKRLQSNGFKELTVNTTNADINIDFI
ncbi:Protein of unknown function [Hathewaya proteolytica DSM 3090]|uniref:DUF4097 domain-containing protein n=1 Tax=Hathewaya proteolytica DSM 3090 TaxID=1121331 RepID=A0A1M6PWX0_9CLOT|nr:DUF4097 family beta strand repeat-containing protein [Hathewaya proteolytica]SHK12388.1 Protein of unknown function [Hathewaya proteolytica DSM 3090]